MWLGAVEFALMFSRATCNVVVSWQRGKSQARDGVSKGRWKCSWVSR